ncbi:hypothetical protein NYE80_34210 [Paenibacillus sp. FSL H7-0357]|uniref:hypothetical protein n=1 Tax=Paenibacillus sp. FSL H7-0357 TaxID=1536774 RepID=UPI0030D3546A
MFGTIVIFAKINVSTSLILTGANNDEDPNKCLPRIRLTKGLWNDAHKGIRNEIDFVNKTAN